jgi:hypothetical protein
MFDRNNCPQCSVSVREQAFKEVGKYLKDIELHGHINRLVILDLMEQLSKGKSPIED